MAPWTSGLIDDSGQPIQLSDMHGQMLLLFFHPRDQTEGCSVPTYSIAKVPSVVHVIAVSLDGCEGQREFLERTGGQFSSLTDEEGALRRAYGLAVDAATKGLHHAFLIGSDGCILLTWSGIDTRTLWKDLTRFVAAVESGG